MVKHNYYNQNGIRDLLIANESQCSHFLRGVLHMVQDCQLGLKYMVNSGKTMRFWKDVWLSGITLEHQFPSLFHICNNLEVTVRSQTDNGQWIITFKWFLSHQRLHDLGVLLVSLPPPPQGENEDSVAWMFEENGNFSVKSSYRNHFKHLPKDAASIKIWKTSAPLKARFTISLSLTDRLLTSYVYENIHRLAVV